MFNFSFPKSIEWVGSPIELGKKSRENRRVDHKMRSAGGSAKEDGEDYCNPGQRFSQ